MRHAFREITQAKRTKTLENFKSGRSKVMVATDVAGRGIHVEGISHVVNYNLPEDPEDYVTALVALAVRGPRVCRSASRAKMTHFCCQT